ncbi:facilitated trehalose transporter Tret1-like isoform X2 [Lycorma delicatula]
MDPEKNVNGGMGICNGSFHLEHLASTNRLNENELSDKEKNDVSPNVIDTASTNVMNGSASWLYKKLDSDKTEMGVSNSNIKTINTSELFRNSGVELCEVSEKKEIITNSRFRSTLSQCLAVGARNLLLLDFGMVDFYPVIIIPALLNAQQGLSITQSEASWLGSLSSISQPLGCLTAALVLEPLGRKHTMMLLNIPFLISWLALMFANTTELLFFITIVQGIGLGAVEATMLSYVSEVSEPKLRGMLVSIDDVVEYIGYMFILFLGSFVEWRTAAGLSAIVPVLSLIAMYQIPETPIWLLSRGRIEEAEKALCWLRGWASPEAVRMEFLQILKYSISSQTTPPSSASSASSLISIFFRVEMMRPLFLVTCFFFFSTSSGLIPVRPFLITVFSKPGFLIDPYVATLISTTLSLAGCVLCTFLLGLIGKRPLALISIGGCALSCFCISSCSLFTKVTGSWFSTAALFSLSFFTGVGMIPLPWIYMSEVFPFRGRNIASGIGAAVSHLFTFIVNLLYLDMEDYLSFSGVFFLYGVLGIVGLIYFFFCLPETEGRTMEEIEEMFKSKKINYSMKENRYDM